MPVFIGNVSRGDDGRAWVVGEGDRRHHAELARVGKHVAAGRPRHGDALDLGLVHVGRGEARLQADAVGAPEAAAEAVATKHLAGVRPNQGLGLGLVAAAEHHEPEPALLEAARVAEGVRHEGHAVYAGQLLHKLQGRGARVDVDEGVGLDELDGLGRDEPLVGRVQVAALGDGEVARDVGALEARGPAVDLGHPVRLVKDREVSPDGGDGDAKLLGKLGHGHRALLVDELDDGVQAVLGKHGATPPRGTRLPNSRAARS